MNRVIIPTGNWSAKLASAVKNADENTVIVVNSEAKKELALIAAKRMNKTVTVEIEV